MRLVDAGRGPLLVVDIGKSGARGHLSTGSARRVATTTGGLAPGTSGSDGAGRAVARIVQELWQSMASAGDQDPSFVVVGSTAVPPPEELRRAFSDLRGVWPHAALVIAEDGVVLHAAAHAGPGVMASVGTGSIVTAMDDRGRWLRRDGWGPDLGDRGSAWWLGTHGLRAAFEAYDGVGPPTALTARARAHLGGLDLRAAVAALARSDRVALLADFARQVCLLAGEDPVAASLLTRAATDMAATIGAVARDAHVSSVSVHGRLGTDATYRRALARALRDHGVEPVTSPGDVVELDPSLFLSGPYAALSYVDLADRHIATRLGRDSSSSKASEP